MSKLSKLGLAMMTTALLIAGIPTLYYLYPVRVPLSTSLPLRAGTTLRQSFAIRGSEK